MAFGCLPLPSTKVPALLRIFSVLHNLRLSPLDNIRKLDGLQPLPRIHLGKVQMRADVLDSLVLVLVEVLVPCRTSQTGP